MTRYGGKDDNMVYMYVDQTCDVTLRVFGENLKGFYA